MGCPTVGFFLGGGGQHRRCCGCCISSASSLFGPQVEESLARRAMVVSANPSDGDGQWAGFHPTSPHFSPFPPHRQTPQAVWCPGSPGLQRYVLSHSMLMLYPNCCHHSCALPLDTGAPYGSLWIPWIPHPQYSVCVLLSKHGAWWVPTPCLVHILEVFDCPPPRRSWAD